MGYKNKEERREYNILYRKNNPEKCKQISKKWVGKNKEKVAKVSKKYYEKNKDIIAAKKKEYKKLPHVKKAIKIEKKAYNKKHRDNLSDVYFRKRITDNNRKRITPEFKLITTEEKNLYLNGYKICYLFKNLILNKTNKKEILKTMVTIQKNLEKESGQLKDLIKIMLFSMNKFIDGEITIKQARVISSMGNITYKSIAGKFIVDQALIEQ